MKPAPEDKASQMLEALISRASNDPRALVTLANHLMANGERDRAVAVALQARTLAAADPEIHLLARDRKSVV